MTSDVATVRFMPQPIERLTVNSREKTSRTTTRFPRAGSERPRRTKPSASSFASHLDLCLVRPKEPASDATVPQALQASANCDKSVVKTPANLRKTSGA